MTLKRTMDATFLNTVANHADVRPWLGGEGELDLSGVIANPANVAVQGEFGGFLFNCLEIGLYEAHSLFLSEGRGAWLLEAAREAQRYLFTHTDCIELVTKVPENNKAALGLGRSIGMSPVFERKNAWINPDGSKSAVTHMSITFSKWVQRDPGVEAQGLWFHKRLEELTAAIGKTIPEHEEDPAHNRAAGAAILMLKAGNPIKAIGLYNRWAKFAGYPLANLVNMNPAIVDMNEAVATMNNGDMEILLCRI